MRIIFILLIISFIVWIFTLKYAERIGNIFIKFIINPIKDLFK